MKTKLTILGLSLTFFAFFMYPPSAIAHNAVTETMYTQLVQEALAATSFDPADLSFTLSTDHFLCQGQETIAHKFLIARDAIVAVIRTNHPNFDQLMQNGYSLSMIEEATKYSMAFASAEIIELLNQRLSVSIDTPAEENFESLINTLQTHPTSIGFCYLSDFIRHSQPGNPLQLLPLDRNENNRIDPKEELYGSVENLQHALWTGKYPRILSNNLVLISQEAQLTEADMIFMNWVLSTTHEVIEANGMTHIRQHELMAQAKALDTNEPADTATANDNWAIILIVIISGLALLSYVIVLLMRERTTDHLPSEDTVEEAFSPQSLSCPEGLFYNKTHTWAFQEKSGEVLLGIDDFIRKIIGKADRIELLNKSAIINKGDVLASVYHQGKKIQLRAAVSGTISEINSDTQRIMDSDDIGNSWLYKIQPTNWRRETDFMMMADSYKSWIKEEFSRIKDFLAAMMTPAQLGVQHIVLQDGGELKTGFMLDMEPEIWEEFENRFLK